MKRWFEEVRKNPRLLVSGLVPIALLVALLLATGNSFFSGIGGSSAPPVPGSQATAPPTRSTVQGEVLASAKHLRGNLWQFLYTVRNTGKTPIAGFQINGPRANLFAIQTRHGWAVFGGGICGGPHPDVLAYWSTGTSSPAILRPHQSTVFGFRVHTTGTLARPYALSWGQASPQFGRFLGPAASSVPADGACKP